MLCWSLGHPHLIVVILAMQVMLTDCANLSLLYALHDMHIVKVPALMDVMAALQVLCGLLLTNTSQCPM